MLRLAVLFLIATLTAASAQTLTRADGATFPIREYDAKGKSGCAPLMIISHGLGGSEQALKTLARGVANAGYRVITMRHRESDTPHMARILLASDRRTAIHQYVDSSSIGRARMADLDATLAYANKACTPPFSVLLGYSMGAQTAMFEAGARNNFGITGKDRFAAYVALSPQGVSPAFPAGAWARINKPILMITGTSDRALEGGYRTRLQAFSGLPRGNKRLAVIAGANHIDIGGRYNAITARHVRNITLEFLSQLSLNPLPRPTPIQGVAFQQK